ncbi:MAG: gamma-glutamyltransferase [Planctomycetota bacterium]
MLIRCYLPVLLVVCQACWAVPGWSADSVFYTRGVVAADHPLASQAGVEILEQGGNVVDAAAATGFALSVLRPASSGIGGGGFMLIWDRELQRSVCIDYRERAPARADRDTYADPQSPKSQIPELSYHGALAIAVPGQVAGLCYAHEKYGKLRLERVLAPAIRLATEGFPADPHDLEIQASVLRDMAQRPGQKEKYRVLFERYLQRGRLLKLGDRIVSPQAEVLKLIARNGAKAFYQGEVARAIVAAAETDGKKWLSLQDLAGFQPTERKALSGRFDRFDLITMPPPSSGGIALIEALNILQAVERDHSDVRIAANTRQAPMTLHLLTEALKHAFADRAEFLGDPDYVPVPVDRLTSPEYAKALAKRVKLDVTHPPEAYGRFMPSKDAGTTHFSIMDAQGNAVACTETVNTLFGSWVVEPQFGIVLNNEMDDFAAVPGTPNAFGLIQGEANAVAAGKRPLSSMTPTIVIRDGKAVHALGASGGPKIISATLQVLLNLTRFEMPPSTAVPAPRLHHQWMPDALLLEPTLFEAATLHLRERGHLVKRAEESAVVQAVSRLPQGLQGTSDPRKHGRAAGF